MITRQGDSLSTSESVDGLGVVAATATSDEQNRQVKIGRRLTRLDRGSPQWARGPGLVVATPLYDWNGAGNSRRSRRGRADRVGAVMSKACTGSDRDTESAYADPARQSQSAG